MPDFFQRYNDQGKLYRVICPVLKFEHYLVRIEGSMTKAWDEAGPKLVQQEALKRLKTSGWSSVRPALTITVRSGYLDFLI
jgi:hypothetical protein